MLNKKFFNKLLLVCLGPFILICSGGCANGVVSFDDVTSSAVAALSGVASYEIAPDDWSNSEKAALAGAVAATAYIGMKALSGKAKKDQLEAFNEGFKNGLAHGARQQFAIIQALQRDDANSHRAIYSIPAPSAAGINKVPYNVYLEVSE